VSTHEILIEAGARAARGDVFVLATVVRRRAPSSARPAQKALVLGDGTLVGWIGGSCMEPVVRREALAALRAGTPRRVVLSPQEAAGPNGAGGPDAAAGPVDAEPALHSHPMTCHSGGTVEIFLEPCLPAPLLALYGDSPVTEALARMAPALGWRVERVPEPDERAPGEAADPVRMAVVATMGVWDEAAAERALGRGAEYVGLVASPRRTAEVRRRLKERGVPEERLARLVGPAGLDLGAESPAEIAVSILAQVVGRRELVRGGVEAADAAPDARRALAEPALAIDPVCGMEVDPERARFTLEHRGRRVFFCCDGCRERFRADPSAYAPAAGEETAPAAGPSGG